MNEEKDKILNEFNRIVSSTTAFKEPVFPKSSKKSVLKPIMPGKISMSSLNKDK